MLWPCLHIARPFLCCFPFQIDIEEMSGSTLEAMAEAVEKAQVIILCVSSHYKDSANCRLEAEWALTCRKPLIPVMVEQAYKPGFRV